MTVESIESVESFTKVLVDNKNVVVGFWADWSKPSVNMIQVLEQLSNQYSNLKFIKVEAEKVHEVSLKYQVKSVPTFVFISNSKPVHSTIGANPSELTLQTISFVQKIENQTVQQQQQPTPESIAEQKEKQEVEKKKLNERLAQLINQAPVMLFMKGHPDKPQCGFSSKTVQILRENGFTFDSFDILSDTAVRNGLKEYSNWPTYPQLYINGKLVGGFDIIKDLNEDGDLADMKP
eukprot:gene4593-5732_t